MPVPGFDDPALASLPPGGNLYFQQDAAVAALIPSEQFRDPRGPGHAQAVDRTPPDLMFGGGVATNGAGEQIVHAADSSGGHWSEVLNFHGSPAPWILIGILLVAGLLHLSANARGKVEL
jgi:hypothetical protein